MTNNPTIDGVSRELIKDMHEHPDCPVEFIDHLRRLLDAPAVERQDPMPSQVPVLRAMAANYRNGHSWDFLDGEAVSKAADEITRMQSTIAQLQARIAELESGMGEPVAWRVQCVHPRAGKQSGLFDEKYQAENWATHWRSACGLESSCAPLYNAPPAPVAVVLPDRKSGNNYFQSMTMSWFEAELLANEYNAALDDVRACLDATAALNEAVK